MIEQEDRGGIAILRLEHGKANAFDRALCEEIPRRFEQLDGARAVVLTGHGHIFSAGVDLKRAFEDGPEQTAAFYDALCQTLECVATSPRPVIAALNGHAIAGGCLLALACDHRVMARGTGRIGAPELRVGVPFPPVAIELLRDVVPPRHLRDVVYRARAFEPEEAVEAGLVDETAPPAEVVARAVERAEELGAIPADLFASAKSQLRAPWRQRVRDAAAENAELRARWGTDETRERVRAHAARTFGSKKS